MIPTVTMILMKQNPISMYYRGRVQRSWEDRGFKIQYYDAITPDKLKDCSGLTFGTKLTGRGAPREFTETEKSVWYSHYYLWMHAANKDRPIIVIEHDAFLAIPIPQKHLTLKNQDYNIVTYCHNKKGGEISDTPCGAYLINNKIAEKMIKDLSDTVINCNCDGFLMEYIKKFGESYPLYCRQIQENNVGTTIDHG